MGTVLLVFPEQVGKSTDTWIKFGIAFILPTESLPDILLLEVELRSFWVWIGGVVILAGECKSLDVLLLFDDFMEDITSFLLVIEAKTSWSLSS